MKRIHTYLLLVSLFILSCESGEQRTDSQPSVNATTTQPTESLSSGAEEASSPEETRREPIVTPPANQPEVPAGYTILSEASGDLLNNKSPELVIVYDTPLEGEFGNAREMRIFTVQQGQWELWHTSFGAIMDSESGGVLGDPFVGVSIERGCIVLEHYGGSREKWSYLHRYRFQDDNWYLIGATTGQGTSCLDWQTFDYNLSTGKAEIKTEKITCGDDGEESTIVSQETFSDKLSKLPLMDDILSRENVFKVPNSEKVYYY